MKQLTSGDATRAQAAAIDRYLTLLKSGGSDHPMTLLQRAGVDLSKPETDPRRRRSARRAGHAVRKRDRLRPAIRRHLQHRVLHGDARVHDRRQPAGLAAPPRLRSDALLQPQRIRADLDRFIGDRRRVLRAPEHVDDVDGDRDVEREGYAFSPEHFGFVRIDGNHAVAQLQQPSA